jgi:hypothetical protein
LIFFLLLLGDLLPFFFLLRVQLVLLLLILLVQLRVAGIGRGRSFRRRQVANMARRIGSTSIVSGTRRISATIGRRVIGSARFSGGYRSLTF